MERSNYVNRFLKTHVQDVAFNQLDLSPTIVMDSRIWDQWMGTAKKIDFDVDGVDDIDGMHATVAFVTITGIPSINNSVSALDLSDDELDAIQLRDTNKNNDVATYHKHPKDKVNKKNCIE